MALRVLRSRVGDDLTCGSRRSPDRACFRSQFGKGNASEHRSRYRQAGGRHGADQAHHETGGRNASRGHALCTGWSAVNAATTASGRVRPRHGDGVCPPGFPGRHAPSLDARRDARARVARCAGAPPAPAGGHARGGCRRRAAAAGGFSSLADSLPLHRLHAPVGLPRFRGGPGGALAGFRPDDGGRGDKSAADLRARDWRTGRPGAPSRTPSPPPASSPSPSAKVG